MPQYKTKCVLNEGTPIVYQNLNNVSPLNTKGTDHLKLNNDVEVVDIFHNG